MSDFTGQSKYNMCYPIHMQSPSLQSHRHMHESPRDDLGDLTSGVSLWGGSTSTHGTQCSG